MVCNNSMIVASIKKDLILAIFNKVKAINLLL